jgi:hypothetical protein
VHDPELGRREADPERVVHELAHAPHLLAQRVVEALDGQRAALERGVAVLADEAQRGVAPRARLGVQARDPLLGRDLRCLDLDGRDGIGVL